MQILRRLPFMALFLALVLSLLLPFSSAQALPNVTPASAPSAEVVNWPVPYVHQLWDTPDSFYGYWACSSASSVMALSYYHKLTPNPITVSSPYSHSNNYGFYVSNIYTAFNYTFNRRQNDSKGNPAYGAYGHTTNNGYGEYERIQDYLLKHGGLVSEYKAAGTYNLQNVKDALSQGYLIIMSTWLTDKGHIILVRGYTTDNKLIVNDPYGNKFGGTGYGKYNGENVQYTWDQIGPKYMLIVKGASDGDDNRTLSPGGTLNGTISPKSDADPYVFSGTAGTTVQISMNAATTGLDSYLELYDPSNRFVTYNDDVSSGNWNSRIEVVLSSTGTYKVIAHTYGYASSGNYQISLAASSGDGDDGRWISSGMNLHGTISPSNDRDTYYVNGTPDTILSVKMLRDPTPLDSYLTAFTK